MRDKIELIQKPLEQRLGKLQELLSNPSYRLGQLREAEVPETIGVYILLDSSGIPIYVGKADKVEMKLSSRPSGLCFRIMYNHLSKAGSDNFLSYIAEELECDKRRAVHFPIRQPTLRALELWEKQPARVLQALLILAVQSCGVRPVWVKPRHVEPLRGARDDRGPRKLRLFTSQEVAPGSNH